MYFVVRLRLNKLGLLGLASHLFFAIYLPAWAFWRAPKLFLLLAVPPLLIVSFYARDLDPIRPSGQNKLN